MRWRLSGAEGVLAGAPLDDVLDNGGILPDAPVEVSSQEGASGEVGWLDQHCRESPSTGRPTWIVLPDRERSKRHRWQDVIAGQVEIGFGRSGITLAMGQINRLKAPATLVAIDRVPGSQPGHFVESYLRVDMEPADTGLGMMLNLVDGRLDGATDLTSMLEQARTLVAQPEVLFLPGTGSDGGLDRLLPSLSAMGNWVGRDVRWEFAEARIGPLGMVGSLFSWYWLYEGFRLGDWQGPAVIMDMDTSPLVGLSVVDFSA